VLSSALLLVNGQPSSLGTATVNGVPYVQLEALCQLGISVRMKGGTRTLESPKAAAPAGSAVRRASSEGCVGQALRVSFTGF